jgi:hypothetical protein
MRSRKSDRRAWLIAWVLALALHAGGIFGFRSLPLPHSAAERSQEPKPIQLVFSSPAPTSNPEEPHVFTELPPDRADAAPKKADFLSNVTSRARDHVPGGDDALPRMQGQGDAPAVGLEPGKTAPPSRQSPELSASRPTNPQQLSDGSRSGPAAPAPSEFAVPQPPGSAGNSDIHQPEMDNPDGNASLTGDVTLSTTAWDYAPWLQRYTRELMSRWNAPMAYYMGLIKDGGWAVIEVEISKSGEMLRNDLLEEQGHPALTTAAQSAVRAVAPIPPLPADFPEPTLILRLRMIYPKYSRPERPRPGRFR